MEIQGILIKGERYSGIVRMHEDELWLTLEVNGGSVEYLVFSAEDILKWINWRDVVDTDMPDVEQLRDLLKLFAVIIGRLEPQTEETSPPKQE